MVRTPLLIAFLLVTVACKKEPAKEIPAPPPSAVADAATTPEDSAAAGSGSAEAGSAGSGSAAEGSGSAGAATPSSFDFEKLSHEDKIKFMKEKVMPTMKAHFQKFDPKEFANFTCKTCHGKDPQKKKYEMPNKELPALDFDAIKAGKEDEKMVKFMGEVVKPEMAKLLNMPEMSETVQDGFGCLHCHTMKKKKK